MWLIKSISGKEFFLVPGKTYVVGRKDNDLVLEGDPSISRKHASLVVSESSTDQACVVTLSDFKSKYGTFKKNACGDWEKLQEGQKEQLGNKDVIRFGQLSQLWTVKKCVVAASNLTATQRKTLIATLTAVSAEFSPSWTEFCTHLTMNVVTLTVKAVCALARGVPLVTPGYWRQFEAKIGQNQPAFLSTIDFIPPFGEKAVDASRVSLDVNEGRKQLFSRLCFVFSNEEQLGKKGCLVTSAGGKAIAYDADVISLEELCQPHMILVNFFSNESQESLTEFTAAIEYSEARGRRRIPEAEIGMAVLECSIERNCNPVYRPLTSLSINLSLDTQTQPMSKFASDSQVLAFETQDSQVQANKRKIHKNIIIPESGSCSTDSMKMETQDETPDNLACNTDGPNRGKGGRKRQGESQLEEPHFKRPAQVSGVSMFSEGVSTSQGTSIQVNVEDSKDFLDFDSGPGLNEDEDDPFNFSKSGRASSSRKRTTEAKDTSDDDLFGSLTPKSEKKKVKLEMPPRLEPEEEVHDDEDMFSTDETDNVRGSPVQYVASERTIAGDSSTKRKSTKATDNLVAKQEDATVSSITTHSVCDQVQQKAGTSHDYVSHMNMSKISLKGFLMAVKVKKQEPIDMDGLEDAIECMVVVEKKSLVVPRKPPVRTDANASDSGPVNFKRFRKISTPRSHPMIEINRTHTFKESVEKGSSSSEDEDRVAQSQQCFDFVTKKRAR